MSEDSGNRRWKWTIRLTLGLFGLAALSQANVHIFSRAQILDRAEETKRFVITRTEVARRGSILSADGKPLAQDEDTRELTINFRKVPNSPGFFMDLAAASGIPASEFEHLASVEQRTRVWRKPMSGSQAAAVNRVKLDWRADGVSLSGAGARTYALGEAAAGFLGSYREGKPVSGLELSQNKTLSGQDGKTVGMVDRAGAFLPMRLDRETRERLDGRSITLTIDSHLQAAAASAIKHAVETNNADSGSAIILDPKTGDVLAMANWPSYDPSSVMPLPASGEVSEDFNPNYMAVLEPGSTFKILTLAKALEDGVVGPEEHFYCKGEMQVWSNRNIHCDRHGGTRAHGSLTPELAIAKSCNVWSATWARQIGYDGFVEFLEDLGILEKTNLGLPLERGGEFNRNEYAKGLQLATFGFGQSLSCTPIGLASAFGMLANDGVRMEPRLIKKIGDKELPPVEAGQVVSADTARQVLKFMEAVVESDAGTGKTLRIKGYRLGGKTGTAEKVNRKTGGGYVSNFVGFVPAQEPQAVIMVMVDRPKAGRYYGSTVAGPVFLDLAKAVIRRYGIPPTEH
jgi:cell division protein FtsI (penicillin-binding protein 3)